MLIWKQFSCLIAGNVAGNVAVNVAVDENFVAVIGPQVAVSFAWSSCQGLPGSGNTAWDQILC